MRDIFMKYTNKLQLLFLSIILLIGVIVTTAFLSKPPDAEPLEPEPIYCGTMYLDGGYEHPVGEQLFKQNCKACHRIHEEVIGPALYGITERRPKKWIYAFIHNSQALIKNGDTMAVNLYHKYHRTSMPSFPEFTEADIDSILIYIETPALSKSTNKK